MDAILLPHFKVIQNAQSVPTTLGGGQLGHLALVIAKEKLDVIPSSAPFEQLIDPGTFTLQAPSATLIVTAQMPTVPTRRTTISSTRKPTAADIVSMEIT